MGICSMRVSKAIYLLCFSISGPPIISQHTVTARQLSSKVNLVVSIKYWISLDLSYCRALFQVEVNSIAFD